MANILIISQISTESSFLNNIKLHQDPFYNHAQKTHFVNEYNTIYYKKALNPGNLFNAVITKSPKISNTMISKYEGVILLFDLDVYMKNPGKIQKICDSIKNQKPILCVLTSINNTPFRFPICSHTRYMIYNDKLLNDCKDAKDIYIQGESFYWFINKINNKKVINNADIIINKHDNRSINLLIMIIILVSILFFFDQK